MKRKPLTGFHLTEYRACKNPAE